MDIQPSLKHFKAIFEKRGYTVIPIKVTDVFKALSKHLKPEVALVQKPLHNRLDSYIKYGNQIRSFFEDDQILAALTITRIINERVEKRKGGTEKTVYFLHQFKRKEEIELLRSVYGRVFFQISIYSRIGARVDYLARSFAQAENMGNSSSFRSRAEDVIQTDQNELDNLHGQRVSAIFHNGDVILNSDAGDESLENQICRFTDLLFGSNKISPTRDEYGMFAAKAAALRTLDLSRQVGAAIFTNEGEIVAMGSNEVPKAGGGTYWSDDPKHHDDRDYVRQHDSNDRRKKEILVELLNSVGVNNDDALTKKAIRNSQFMDGLEYGRIIHAEMSAICDAARTGRKLEGATLYSTTFPCHMCAKHIVAAGITRVVFLEPYPKSLTAELHSDSVRIEGADRGKFQEYPAVDFMHFHGISHRRYREMFERGRRKDDEGQFVEWQNSGQPIIDLKFPFYLELEKHILKACAVYLEQLKLSVDELNA